jgi:(p)ppGpp synthase/HD superfamily hydrolase
MTDIVERARLFATAAHAAIGQTRKYSDGKEPYIVHPAEVVQILQSTAREGRGYTVQMEAAAWLHDVVEDTEITLDLIKEIFGSEVRDLVYWLTDDKAAPGLNRAARKQRTLERLATAPDDAKTLKTADCISNAHSIFEKDPNFAKVYLREMNALLDVLDGADPILLKRLRDILGNYSGIIH